MRQGSAYGTPLSKAVAVAARVFADLAYRALTYHGDSGTSYAAWTRRGMLVVAARGEQARALVPRLAEVGIEPQRDKPEHIDPEAVPA